MLKSLKQMQFMLMRLNYELKIIFLEKKLGGDCKSELHNLCYVFFMQEKIAD